MSNHALLSPSSAHRWMLCAGSVAMEQGEPQTDSAYADEGTAAHYLGALCLANGTHPAEYIGRTIHVTLEGDAHLLSDEPMIGTGRTFPVDSDMARFVNTYVQGVLDFAKDGELLVEQSLPIGHITGEEGAAGTGDAVILGDDELTIVDLKYGRGVQVSAEKNPQLMLYALGALEAYSMLGDFTRVRLVISQPRIASAFSEWDISVEELVKWGKDHAEPRAYHAMQVVKFEKPEAYVSHLTPSDEACKFCKAKAKCPKLIGHVLTAVTDDFVDLDQPETIKPKVEAAMKREMDNTLLGALLNSVDLIEDFCKMIRAKGESELLNGRAVPGYKLVEGRQGNRAWTNTTDAEAMLKSMRIKHEDMYEYKVISPTTAEKLAKDKIIGERQWPKLQALISRSEGKPTVAPESDKRPALTITPVIDEFDVVEEEGSELV